MFITKILGSLWIPGIWSREGSQEQLKGLDPQLFNQANTSSTLRVNSRLGNTGVHHCPSILWKLLCETPKSPALLDQLTSPTGNHASDSAEYCELPLSFSRSGERISTVQSG